MATTTITFNGGSTTSATSNTSTNPSPQPSDHRDPLAGPEDDGANFHQHHHHNNNNSVTSARALAHEKHEREEPDPEQEEDEEEEGEIRRREVVSESSVDSCSQEELLHHRHDDRGHDHGSSASSVSRNKKRKQSRPIRIPCTNSSASLSPHAHSATGALTPLNLSAKPNHHNGASAAASSMHAYMPFNLPMYQHASAGASASISPSSPSSSSNSNSEPESRSGGGVRRRLSAGAVELGDRDGSSRGYGTATGQSQSTGSSNHHHHNHHRIFNPEAYCDLCNKEFCNKYFLKTHKANKHGVYSDVLPTQCQLPTTTAAAMAGSSAVSQAQHQTQQLMDASSSSVRDSFCHLCSKDFCNKYFLRRHRAKIHGIQSSASSGGRPASGWAPDENESMEEGETTRPEGRKRGHHHQSQNRDTESKGSSSSSTTSNCGLCGPSGPPYQHHRHHHDEGGHNHQRSRGPGEQHGSSETGSRKQADAMQNNNVLGPSQATAPGPGSGAVFECSLCSHTFPSIYLLHMHMSYFHSVSQLPSVSVPFSHSTDSIVSSAAPMAYLGLKLGPSPSPPTTMQGLKQQQQQQNSAQAQDDDLRRLQSMILELSQGGGRAAAAASASATSVICPICCKEFYSSYFLSQHIATAHSAFSSIGLPLPSLTKESLSSSQQQQHHQHQLHMQLKREADESEDAEEMRKSVMDEVDDDEGKNLCKDDRQPEAGRGGSRQDGQSQNEMMMMMMMMNAGAAAAVSAAGSLGIEDDESNNNTRESRNGHKKSRSTASRNTTSGASLLLQDPIQSASGAVAAAAAARATPAMLPKSQKPVSPSLSRSYCTICHKELCNKYFMRTHMLKMHGINIESSTGLGGVTCDICHKELCSKYFLKVHKQNTHGIIEEIGVAPILTATPAGAAAGGVGTPESTNGLEDETASTSGRRSQNESPSGSQHQPPKRLRGPGGKWTSARTKGVNGGGVVGNNEDQVEAEEDEYEQSRSSPQSADNQEPRQIKQELTVSEICLGGSPRDGGSEDGQQIQFQPDPNTPTPMLDPLSMLLQKMDGGSGKLLYCRYCSFSTSLLVYLYAHERTHATGTAAAAASHQAGMEQVQLQCPMCFMTFVQVDQFQQHLVSHQLGPVASPQPTTATATASVSQAHSIRDTTHERRVTRHRINNNDELEYKIHPETAEPESRPQRRRVRVVRFKCSFCGQRFGLHADCQSHVLHAHAGQRPGRAQRRMEPYNDNSPIRRFECKKCGFVAPGQKSLLVHSATSHRGRGWRSANTQRFLRAPLHSRTFGARRKDGAQATKQTDDAADLIVQRFLLHPDMDVAAEPSDGDAEAAVAGGGGKKSGYFVPSVIYLPVREIVSESLRVSLTPHASSKY